MIPRRDLRAELLHFAAEVLRLELVKGGGLRRVKFDRLNLLAIDPQADVERVGSNRATAAEEDADDVLAIYGEAVCRVNRIGQCQPGQVVIKKRRDGGDDSLP